MNESDGMGEVFDDLIRQALMVAARVAEIAARARQEQLVRERTASEQRGREAQVRFDSERSAARAALAPTNDDQWWRTATAEQIGAAYETAATWKDHDADVAATAAAMEKRFSDWGIDLSGDLKEDSELIRAREWAAQADPERSSEYNADSISADNEQKRAAIDNGLVTAYLATPEHNPEAEELADDSVLAWDDASRHEAFAASLIRAANQNDAEARVLADVAQGTHPSTAVKGTKSAAAKASKAKLNTSKQLTKTR